MLYVALTGNIASGKSTVARDLAARGATLIDSDQLARDVVAPGSEALRAIVNRFGPEILKPDGSLDRAAMRQQVFSDTAAREALNAIVHPAVRRLRDQRVEKARQRGDHIVVADIPLLFELGLQAAFDAVILVDADETVRRDRLVHTRGLSGHEAQAMIDAQMPSALKREGATWVIDNNGPLEALAPQVEAVWQALTVRAVPPLLTPRFRNDAS